MASSPRDQQVNNFLRGLAILAVVIIHTQGSVHGGFWIGSPTWRIFSFTDQLSRMCVPLFVALSGYGFWQKYQGRELKAWEFIWRQATKLLPMYLVASVITYGILYYFYYRHASGPLPSLWLQIVTGQADYQMYFVPMIFQLYLLFPWLRILVQKFRWSSLALAGLFQGVLYSFSTHLGSDQQQYVWFFTWIFYFILGMHLSAIGSWFASSLRRTWALVAVAVTTWVIISFSAMSQMTRGVDPIVALRFTRVELLLYAGLAICALFVLTARAKSFAKPLIATGRVSYYLYLYHTLALRAIFAFI